jgi:hypothetical protein
MKNQQCRRQKEQKEGVGIEKQNVVRPLIQVPMGCTGGWPLMP